MVPSLVLKHQGVRDYPEPIYRYERQRLVKMIRIVLLFVISVSLLTYLLAVANDKSASFFLSIGASLILLIIAWLFSDLRRPYNPSIIFKFSDGIEGFYAWVPSDHNFIAHVFDVAQNTKQPGFFEENVVFDSIVNFLSGGKSISFSSADLCSFLLILKEQAVLLPGSDYDFVQAVSRSVDFFQKGVEKNTSVTLLAGDLQTIYHSLSDFKESEMVVESSIGTPSIDMSRVCRL